MKQDPDLDALFAELKEEQWPADRLGEWREKVRERRVRSRPWMWLLPVPALAAALLLVLLRPHAVAPPVSLAKAPPAPTVALRPAIVTPPAMVARVSKPRPPALTAVAAKRAEPEQTEFIRIMTDDPDVVILWAVNGNGEAQ